MDTWHVTRVTCLLRVPWAGPSAVDSFRQWNFSICSKNIGDMAILVEGYNYKKWWKLSFPEKTTFLKILLLYPSTKMAITPMFFEQIEKFQCLKLSTAQGPAHGTLRRHVARVHVPKNVSWSLWTLRLKFFEIPPSKDFKNT